MKTNWVTIIYTLYLAAVCLIAGVTLCFSTASMVNNAITYTVPEMRISWYDLNHLPKSDNQTLTAEEETALRAARKTELVEREQWQAMRNMLDMLVTLLIALVVFVFHWRLFQKERKTA